MKRKGKYLLATALLLTMGISNVKAVDGTSPYANGNINGQCAKLVSSGGHDVLGYWVSSMSLAGQGALCISPGLRTSGGTLYTLAYRTSNQNYCKALRYLASGGEVSLATKLARGSNSHGETGQCIAEQIKKGKSAPDASYYCAVQEKNKANSGGACNTQVCVWTAPGKQTLITFCPSTTEECVQVPYCFIDNNGTYYGKNGDVVDQATWEEECAEKPEEKGKPCPDPNAQEGSCELAGHYYDLDNPNGNEAQFNILKSCVDKKGDYTPANQISEKYCKAYCVEDLYTNFPGGGTFMAGQYYTIGDSNANGNIWGPIEFIGDRQCRSIKKEDGYGNKTEGINTEQWIADYNTEAKNEIDGYNEWKNAIRQQQAIDRSQSGVNSGDSESKCWKDYSYECPNGWAYDENTNTCEEYNPNTGYYDIRCSNCREAVCPSGYTKSNGRCKKGSGVWYPKETYDRYNANGKTSDGTVGGSCDKLDDITPSDSKYQNAKANRQKLINVLKECGDFTSFGYDMAPEVIVSADFDYTFSYTMKASEMPVPVVETIGVAPGVNGSGSNGKPAYCSGTACQASYYNCSGDYCLYSDKVSGETIDGVNVEQKIYKNHKVVRYSLDVTEFRFAKKDGTVDATNEADAGKHTYIDLGDAVIPISYSITPGTYPITIDYSGGNLGHENRFRTKITSVPLTSTTQCSISIINDIEGNECQPSCPDPDPDDPDHTAKGIDVIYRTIKLGPEKVAFPGKSGEGRYPGKNWYTPDGSIVAQYITNNRNVKGDEVYKKDPLYTVTLTPTAIKEIRDYNSKTAYADFYFECKSEGKYCLSDFIHKTVSIGGVTYDFGQYFKNQNGKTGTCQNVTMSSITNDNNLFLKCADK